MKNKPKQKKNSSRIPAKEPIAIVGIGCRFPGGVNDPKSFWKLLSQGHDAITDIPGDRWDIRKFYDPDPGKPGKTYSKQAGYLAENHEYFDPLFFGISPREAESLDPQQRLLLEVVWEGIEDAGFRMDQMKGSPTGVFVGAFCLDSMLTQFDAQNRHLINSNTSASTAMAILANRISYVFDFQGPSVAMDTACSSSLVACHFACQSIWNQESSVAIAGGVNVMTRPEFPIVMSKGKFLSPHCRCMTFDERADGYVRGEGAGVVILKPYKKALADKDHVYALILGSGVNQDGHTPGIFFPNQKSQMNLIRNVYHQAGIKPSEIQYVEAHGTGTRAGDSSEAIALDRILKKGRNANEKCFVGSVKTNIGHLEAAAGIAGLIKTVLCLQCKKIPPNLHFQTPNREIPFDKMCIEVPTLEKEIFPNKEGRIFAGVNSFGYGGTNAHILLESMPENEKTKKETFCIPGGYRLVPLSAKSEKALQEVSKNLFDFLTGKKGNSSDFNSLVYTLGMRRSHHPHRLAIIAKSKGNFVDKLRAFTNGEFSNGVDSGKTSEPQQKLVFVYTGMGPQWWGMGRELLNSQPLFRNMVEDCDALFRKISGWSILAELYKDEYNSRISNVEISQPANFIIQVALTELWKSWGILPDAVVGHSVGEVAAAYIAGSLSLYDALTVTYFRSRLQQNLAGKGSMLVTASTEMESEEFLQKTKQVSIAACNSPNSITLSGSTEAIQEIAKALSKKKTFHQPLRVDVAYHSYQMDPMEKELLKELAGIIPKKSKIPLYSTVTGDCVRNGAMDAGYWWRNVRQKVVFEKAISSLIHSGFNHFLEIGPHPILSAYIKECLFAKNREGETFSSLNRKQSEQFSLLSSLGKLFTKGFPVQWEAITPGSHQHLQLPTYPWQKERYWLESKISCQDRLGQKGNVFLNENKFLPDPTWEVEINPQFFPYLNHHQIQNAIIFPASGYVEAGIALYQHLFGLGPCILENLQFLEMLVVEPTKVQKLQTGFHTQEKTFTIHSNKSTENPNWTLHARGDFLTNAGFEGGTFSLSPKGFKKISIKKFYQACDAMGLTYGKSFKSLLEIYEKDKEVLGKIEQDPSLCISENHDFLHPTLLDACFQTLLAPFLTKDLVFRGLFVPVSIQQVRFFKKPTTEIWCYGKINKCYEDEILGDLTLFDHENNVISELIGICFKLSSKEKSNELISKSLYELRWVKKSWDTFKKPGSTKNWLVFDTEENWSVSVLQQCLDKEIQFLRLLKGKEFRRNLDDSISINPADSKHIKKIFNVYEKRKFDSILYLWSLDQDEIFDHAQTAVNHCLHLVNLAQALATRKTPISLYIVTHNCQPVLKKETWKGLSCSPIWGLCRVIANEHPHISCKVIDLDFIKDGRTSQLVAQEIVSEDSEKEIAIRQRSRWVHRLEFASSTVKKSDIQKKNLPSRNRVALALDRLGDLNSFYFREMPRRAPGAEEVEIQTHFAALNFKDMLKCYGRLPRMITEGTFVGSAMGMECSGTIIRKGRSVTNFQVGDSVITTYPEAFSSFFTLPTTFVMHKPEALQLHEAPVLICFITAQYCLINLAHLAKGEKILIHNASGGVGLAAIQVAKSMGAKIFATAGRKEKREYLRSIGIKHVYNSRSLEFSDAVRRDTNGTGVDVVIGAVSGPILQKSFSLLAPYGRYLELGKKDILENNGLAMQRFNENVSFFGVDLDRMMRDKPQEIQQIFSQIRDGFQKGNYQAIPTSVFSASKIGDAFNLMARSQHIGKIVIQFKNEGLPIRKETKKQNWIKPNKSYLIVGGTKGIGLAFSQYLSEKGATHLILASRRGKSSELSEKILTRFRQNGTELCLEKVDIADKEQVAKLFQKIEKSMPSICGIFHCAATLDDACITNLNHNRLQKVMIPKIKGALNLQKHATGFDLDFFVLFSSISSVIGNSGQANYAAANSFLDAFAHFSRSQGVPAITVNWGAFSEKGMVSKNNKLKELFERIGIRLFNDKEARKLLDKILIHKPIQIGAFYVDWKKWASLNNGKKGNSLLTNLLIDTKNPNAENQNQLWQKLKSLNGEQKTFLEQILKDQIGKILRISPKKLEVHGSLNNLGLDSLMAAELRLTILKEFGIEFSTADFLQNITISQMVDRILKYIKENNFSSNERVTSNNGHQTNHADFAPIIQKASSPPRNGKPFKLPETVSPEDSSFQKEKSHIHNFPAYTNLKQRMIDLRQQAEVCGISNPESPYFRLHTGVANHQINLRGKKYINFSSYNYLGLSGNPQVTQAAKDAITKYGTSVSASRMVSGERPIHLELENTIAKMMGTEAAMVFVSGHATNVTVIGHLLGVDDLILHDAFIHDSVVQGATLSGAKRLSFPHNDLETLNSLLEKNKRHHDKILIVAEGIYSMDGDLSDLPALIEIKKRHHALLMIDEAHSLGVLGKRGFGIGEYFRTNSADVDIWMGTLSKAFASCGGFVAGCHELIEYLKYTAPGFRYSVGLSPANAAAALAAINVLIKEPQRVHRLQEQANLFSQITNEHNIKIHPCKNSPIIPLILRDSSKTLRLAHHLFHHKINVQPILFPAVAEDSARLRFFLSSLHTEEQILFTVDTLAKEIKKL